MCTWGYFSLGDPTWQHEVWRKILLNTNSLYLTEAFKSMHTLFLLTKSAAARLFHCYQIKLMIWAARKQYYLAFWDLLELKSMNILIKTGLYFHHSFDIISACYLYDNRIKWFRSQTCENVAGTFEIRNSIFYLFFILMIYTYKLLKAFPPKHL